MENWPSYVLCSSLKKKTIVIIPRHQLGAATVKVTADLQLLLKNAVRVGRNQRKHHILGAVEFKHYQEAVDCRPDLRRGRCCYDSFT